jgi:predicted N-acetyltransferase YhbS
MSNEITIRRVTPADAPEIARIVFDAFGSIAGRHNFPLDFPAPEMAAGMTQMMVSHPQVFGVVAERDGRVVGSNFLDQRDAIAGVGPITVDPNHQSSGVGRRLMQAVIERGRSSSAAGIRLVQDAFNTASMSLYTSLGFDPREPLALMRGKPRDRFNRNNGEVRSVAAGDIESCAALCTRVHGFDRAQELRDATRMFGSMLLQRNGRVVAYASAPTFWFANHGVAETEADMRDLLLGAGDTTSDQQPLTLLVPIRHASLFRWLLGQGLRVLKPMTLMSMGEYHDPNGCSYPSVAY